MRTEAGWRELLELELERPPTFQLPAETTAAAEHLAALPMADEIRSIRPDWGSIDQIRWGGIVVTHGVKHA